MKQGLVCDTCVMPLMLYRGRMVCVVCHRGEDGTMYAAHGGAKIGPARSGVLARHDK